MNSKANTSDLEEMFPWCYMLNDLQAHNSVLEVVKGLQEKYTHKRNLFDLITTKQIFKYLSENGNTRRRAETVERQKK